MQTGNRYKRARERHTWATAPAGSSRPMGVYDHRHLFHGGVVVLSRQPALYALSSPSLQRCGCASSRSPAAASLVISELNGLLTVVASWLLFGMRRISAGLLLASTLLIAGLALISWPVLLQHSWHIQNAATVDTALLLGGSNLVLHIMPPRSTPFTWTGEDCYASWDENDAHIQSAKRYPPSLRAPCCWQPRWVWARP